ncbi:MAG: excinuclease ABC subunit UvrC, partial [Coriobacteriales bacterium]|nr:excinuclease ABC subunit UvrC [Coriobacteriales bacterium]
MKQLANIAKQLTSVPLEPGVYLWKDAEGTVLYVGKARQLRARMRQYTALTDERAMIPRLMEQVASFDYIVTDNEHESLVLEKNLINQYSPSFNVDFKDDKSYPFIALTMGDTFPAIKFTREKPVANTRYFGPYTDARAARMTIDTARRIVPLCSAKCVEWKRLRTWLAAHPELEFGAGAAAEFDKEEGAKFEPPPTIKPCFDSHVGIGPGICSGGCTPAEYTSNVRQISQFLSGKHQVFIKAIESEMQEAAAELDFERASRAKSRLNSIAALRDKQHVVVAPSLNADVIGFFREETIAGVHLFSVREGVVNISNEFVLDKGLDIADGELTSQFLLRYYEQATDIPREIVIASLSEDATELEEWLTSKLASARGAKVRLSVAKRGERHELLALAERNAKHTLLRYKVRTRYDDERINRALLELESALALPKPPLRIECFDISTIHGTHSVASMVVFNAGSPDKAWYRRFKVRLDTGEANDVAMMSEVLARRYAPDRMADGRFGTKPDLLIIDGGKPQLTAALAQLKELGIEDISVAGLAKRDEELFVPWGAGEPVVLPTGSPALYLVKQV